MKKSRAIYLVVLASILVMGCSHKNKDLESLNREQARVIADLSQQVTGLQQELDRTKSGSGAAHESQVAGTSKKSNYIK